MEIGLILNHIKDKGFFKSIQRLQYLPYKMDYALQVVEEIGKQRKASFVIDNENRFTYENLIRWIHGDPEMKCLDPITKKVIPGRLTAGIYIAGNTGSGKSWALEIMSAYTTIDNVKVIIGDNTRCLHWENVRADTICENYTKEGTMRDYETNPIIGIQDLGAEPTESLFMGNRMSVLRQLLEYRGDFTDRITLISSNIPLSHKMLTDKYGDRVFSRLNEMCNYLEITGKDRRK